MITAEMIQAFLSIAEYRNITIAANSSFTTQSNFSKQIRALEEETGRQLLIRHRGHSEVVLTQAGKEFLILARRWRGLMDDMNEIRNLNEITEVSIGAFDRLNTFTLQGFYRSMLKEHPELRIDVHTRHSREIYNMMEHRDIDIGIVSTVLPTYNIKISELYVEKMCVVCNAESNLGNTVSPGELDPNLEIYSRWSDEFEVWHDQNWPGRRYRIHVGTSSMSPFYLDEPGRWTIMPVNTIEGLKGMHNITVHRLSIPYPAGKIYLLEQNNPSERRQEAISLFSGKLTEYLKSKNRETV
ncbi:MAG: LysR family transcriptional regulator [Solobacterium sp.]|nr:LysR family transcriptional regulator [Solobacterium sp.]